jgi:hypothetical protein
MRELSPLHGGIDFSALAVGDVANDAEYRVAITADNARFEETLRLIDLEGVLECLGIA